MKVRVNELYPSVVTKVIQQKKYAARDYDLVKIFIHKLPTFFKPLFIARLQASICLNLILPEAKLCKAYSPSIG